jgi:hypothetical protein
VLKDDILACIESLKLVFLRNFLLFRKKYFFDNFYISTNKNIISVEAAKVIIIKYQGKFLLRTGLELWELSENLKNAAAKGYKMRNHCQRTFPARGFCRECSKFELPWASFSPFPCAACFPPVPALRCVAAPPSLFFYSLESHSPAISLFPVSVSSASALLFTIGVFLRQNFSGRAHAFFSSVFFGLFLHRSFGKLKRRYPCRRQGCL